MIINDKEYGEFDVYLVDDGTLDTVIGVSYETSEEIDARNIRFSQEYAADFRNKNGAITNDGFEQLAQEAVEAYIEQYLI